MLKGMLTGGHNGFPFSETDSNFDDVFLGKRHFYPSAFAYPVLDDEHSPCPGAVIDNNILIFSPTLIAVVLFLMHSRAQMILRTWAEENGYISPQT